MWSLDLLSDALCCSVLHVRPVPKPQSLVPQWRCSVCESFSWPCRHANARVFRTDTSGCVGFLFYDKKEPSHKHVPGRKVLTNKIISLAYNCFSGTAPLSSVNHCDHFHRLLGLALALQK